MRRAQYILPNGRTCLIVGPPIRFKGRICSAISAQAPKELSQFKSIRIVRRRTLDFWWLDRYTLHAWQTAECRFAGFSGWCSGAFCGLEPWPQASEKCMITVILEALSLNANGPDLFRLSTQRALRMRVYAGALGIGASCVGWVFTTPLE